MVRKSRKCKQCSEKKMCSPYRDVWVCDDCYSHYMSLKITCKQCKNKVQRAFEYIPQTGKLSFCSKKCYESYMQEQQDKEDLVNWLLEYHGVEKLNSRIYMQIETMAKKGKKYKGILLTLQYVADVLNKAVLIDTIAIVDWEYDNCKNYHIKQRELKKSLEAIDETFTVVGEVAYTPIIANEDGFGKILTTEIEFEGEEYYE